jgi:DDE superfamily endonuclease
VRALPTQMVRFLTPFAPLFSKRVWPHVQVLLAGAILAPGKRTVAPALRAVGLEKEPRFCRYHRVLSRVVWSSREVSRVLLGALVKTFVPEGPLVLGVDETLERRQGKRITAKGIYRDPVRSSHEHFVKNQRSQMGVRDSLGRGPVGLSGLGVAILERSSPLRALRQGAVQEAAQEAYRVGLAAAPTGEALASETPDRCRRRRRLRLFEAPRPLPPPQGSGYLHHPP